MVDTHFIHQNLADPYDNPHVIVIQFDADVRSSLTADDLWLSQVPEDDDDEQYPRIPTSLSTSWDANAGILTASFIPQDGRLFDSGRYRASIAQEDVAGLDEPLAYDFVFQNGDADMDNDADGIDIGIWAQNFTGELGGTGNSTWDQGDRDFDTDVDGVDAGIWAQNFTGELGGGPDTPFGPDSIGVWEPIAGQGMLVQWMDEVGGELGWRVQISDNGQTFDRYVNLPADTQAWTDTAVLDGTRYWYRVRAYGNGVDTAYTPKRARTTVFSAPTEVVAYPASPTSVDVIWRDQSRTETRFVVLRSDDGGQTFDDAGTSTTARFTDPNVSAGQSYLYRVVAENENTEIRSGHTTTIPAETPSTSAVSTLTGDVTGPDTLDFSWSAVSGATEYQIEISFDGVDFGDTPAAIRPASITAIDFERLEPDEVVFLRISAYNGSTLIGSSNIASATTTRPAPDEPVSLKAVYSDDEIDVSWVAGDPYADHFVLQRSINGGDFEHRFVAPAGTSSFTDTLVPVGATSVSYRVKAANTAGESDFSNVAIADDPPSLGAQMPPQRRFLISFYGAEVGPPTGEGNSVFFRRGIHERASAAYGYETLNPTPLNPGLAAGTPYRDFEGPTALQELLAAIDANADYRISQVEIDAVEVRLLGWSLGAVEAITLSRMLNDTTGRVGSFAFRLPFHLDAPIAVEDLVLIDPVIDGLAPTTFRIARPIEDNVQNLVNYYQRRGGTSALDYYLQNTYQSPFPIQVGTETYPRSQVLGVDLRGMRVRPANFGTQTQVDISGWAEEVHDWFDFDDPAETIRDGVMVAAQVNHRTIVWWVQPRVLLDLG